MRLLKSLLRRRGGRRAAVIGLDGVGLPLVSRLTAAGVMPRLSEFMQAGSVGPMLSTLPTVSSVSWAAFLSGNNPGRHGIYGFTDLDPIEFKQYFNNFSHLKGATLLDHLDRQDRKVALINVPGTYPARPLNGLMVSGFVAINLQRAVYPPRLLPRLEEAGYKIDVDYVRADERKEEFFCDLFDTLEKRGEILSELARTEAWDLFVGVVTETDRLHHYFWHAWEDEADPYHQRFLDFYARLDGVIGQVLDAVGDVPVIVMADHGHMLIDSEFYPNAWLRDQGLLIFKNSPPQTVADIDETSVAFVMDPGRLYLNLRGRYPTGSVDPASAESVLKDIGAGLLEVGFEGKPALSRLYWREEIYHGELAAMAPDMVMHFNPGFDIKASLRRQEIFGRSALTGMHTYDDAFFCATTTGMDLDGLDIIDMAPTLLAALGADGAETMDGRDRGLR
ncbi:MAG: alkaline phosphatase family protein [Deltaproteobacteria bacterium]